MTARTPEYVQRDLMRGLSAVIAEQYGQAAPLYIPDIDRIETTAQSLNDKVQKARKALADVAMAVNDANQLIGDASLEFQQGKPTLIPGIDEGVLKYLDAIDRRSAPEKTSVEALPENLLESLAWFDAIDDGTPRHLVTRSHRQQASGQSGYNSENREVVHDVLRKEDDVYVLSHYVWETRDWRALSKSRSSAREIYFRRRADGSVSPAVSARYEQSSKDYNDNIALSSPLFNAHTGLLPFPLSTVGYELKKFKRAYTVQARMHTTLSLLGALPADRGWRWNQPTSYDTEGKILTEHNLTLSGGRSFGVTAYGEYGQSRSSPAYVGIQDNTSMHGFGVNCNQWQIYAPDKYAQEKGVSSAVLDEINDALRFKLRSFEELA